ncbi:MAG TPA: hypothetical protein VF517_13970 [Thermoleophilaceae bacterium]
MKRLLGLMATLIVAAVFAVGCGGDDDDGGGSGTDAPSVGETAPSEGGGSGGTDQPDNKDEAIDRCYEEAKKLEGQARETAEAGCKAADTGDTDQLKDEAKQQCLDSAKQIPDEAARKQAEQTCDTISK